MDGVLTTDGRHDVKSAKAHDTACRNDAAERQHDDQGADTLSHRRTVHDLHGDLPSRTTDRINDEPSMRLRAAPYIEAITQCNERQSSTWDG